MNRLILWIVGGFALLSMAYLGFVKLAFEPAEVPRPVTQAPDVPSRLAPVAAAPSATPPPAVPLPPRPATSAAPPPAPDTSDAPTDTAAVRRLTVALAERARAATHVGKPVASHIARTTLDLGPDDCTTTDGVQLCLQPSPVGGWQIVGTSGAYAVTARGPAALGEPLTVRTN